MLGQILVCPHWDTELAVSAMGHKVSIVSVLGHTAECPHWDTADCPHWDTQLPECPY
jgi:hypothetical protein